MKTECELSDSLNDFSDRLCELDLYHDEIVEDADLRGRITHTLTDMTSNLLVFPLLVNSGELYLTDDEDHTLKDMTQWVAETTEYYQSIA